MMPDPDAMLSRAQRRRARGEEPDVADDIRDALGSERPPEYWQARSDYIARFWWRVLFFVLAVLVLGGLAELLT